MATSTTWATWTSTLCDSTASSDTWHSWISDSTSTSTHDKFPSGTTWHSWASTDTYAILPGNVIEFEPTILTHKQIQANLRTDNQTHINRIWIQMEKEEAEAIAHDLLEDLLDDNQLEIYKNTGRVLVKGRKHDYIVRRHGTTIKRVGKNKVQDLCCHLSYPYKNQLPPTDDTIAKILAIKYDEEHFNKLANHHHIRNLNELPDAAKAA